MPHTKMHDQFYWGCPPRC